MRFSTLHSDGSETNIRYIDQSDTAKCRFFILASEHNRENGTCKCDDADHRRMMIKEWGYKVRDFRGVA